YNSGFNSQYRDVRLEGEAFFEVTSNTQIPFRVWAKRSMIQVFGTSFNVKAYQDEGILETTVVEGLVKVFPIAEKADEEKPIALSAEQQVTVSDAWISEKLTTVGSNDALDAEANKLVISGVNVVSGISTESVIYWKEDKWVIKSETLKDLSLKIERRYNVKIHLNDPVIETYIFSGVIRDESLEQVLRAISASSPVDFIINEQSVTIYKKGRKIKN
ncbi:MAG: FecR family protein, partial [Bacteroidales bacterium]|nr:FecR family protein [Bacteroidales bacterium]